MNNSIELRNFLFEIISENKKSLFEKNIEFRTKKITVVLEDIFQSHNASAVLRSADLFGIQDIHIIENRNQYKVNPDVALGSSKWLSIEKYNSQENNTLECFEMLKSKGYKIVATSPHENDILLDELPINEKIAVVFGTELNGLSKIALDNADAFVKIPMYGFTESFNISVSAALCMYNLTDRLRKSAGDWQLTKDEKVEIQIAWAMQSIKRADVVVKEFLSRYHS
ncbi:MAG: rRNA methyltransferase [Bacteroidetes bacterium CG2_30_33_31]|nr:MAG: rRNA methyltransferase [Bacteroidetes bacterium CG2_30_33_31]